MKKTTNLGTQILAELIKHKDDENLNGQPVMRLIEGKEKNVTTYLRYDAVVKTINEYASQSLPEETVRMIFNKARQGAKSVDIGIPIIAYDYPGFIDFKKDHPDLFEVKDK